jgi:hypothetical protein
MHAVVLRVDISDPEASEQILKEEVVPRVASAPGFVYGTWVRMAGDKGTSMVVFESEEAANAAREQMQPPPNVTVESAEVGEVVARA